MRRFENKVHGPEMIAAILDMIDTVHIGIFDGEYPYAWVSVVPVIEG